MLDVRRLPVALVASTFALSGLVATTGAASVAMGVGGGDAYCSDVDPSRPAGRILECLGPSTGYVETAIGSGTALMLDDGYLLTNAHVVDPFDEVTVTLGDETHEVVQVVGVDLFADIAVLGPIETDVDPVRLIDPVDLRKGDRLFLVGYPGEANTEDLEPTIADGILSRTRTSKDFDLHYLQTDASIGGGQSGGALVDVDGAVVGISSLRFAENFALALSGADAQAAVAAILAGNGLPVRGVAGAERVQDVTLRLDGDEDTEYINLPVFGRGPDDRRDGAGGGSTDRRVVEPRAGRPDRGPGQHDPAGGRRRRCRSRHRSSGSTTCSSPRPFRRLRSPSGWRPGCSGSRSPPTST